MGISKTNRKGAHKGTFSGYVFSCWLIGTSALTLIYIAGPLAKTISAPTLATLWETLRDPDVISSIALSLSTSGAAAILSMILGTPLAYLLARTTFRGKKLVESLIDLPIMIPHPVIGISLLTLTNPNTTLGKFLEAAGIEFMGTKTGIIAVLFFVGLPFYIMSAKAGFESIPVRLEKVSKSLGANSAQTFLRITLPLSWRHILSGMIMCMARALSEFGAIIIVAYHPMVAPVLMYERFTAYGLAWSQPVAVLLILISLLVFILMRTISLPQKETL
ncbi:MAG: ABC transporter permease [Desulfovibrionales bacterium]|nr:ABC transporter permease [Desulfovibrionales bacterium]